MVVWLVFKPFIVCCICGYLMVRYHPIWIYLHDYGTEKINDWNYKKLYLEAQKDRTIFFIGFFGLPIPIDILFYLIFSNGLDDTSLSGLIEILDNVYYVSKDTKINADKVEIDLLYKKLKISMINNKDKVNIVGKY